MRRSAQVVLTLAYRLRRQPNVKPALATYILRLVGVPGDVQSTLF